MKSASPDRFLLLLIAILVVGGFAVFISASLGLLARDGAGFGAVALKQAVFGLGLGGLAFVFTLNTNYKNWRKYSFWIFLASLILTILVFIPHIGMWHGGAKRWIEIGRISFQPGEILKIAFIIYYATWLSAIKNKDNNRQMMGYGVIPFIGLMLVTGGVLLAQPDTDGFLVIALSGVTMLFLAGARLRYFLLFLLVGIVGVFLLFHFRPYIKSRIMTFVNMENVDTLGAGYQINQSLIAIGGGGLTGRGFGQSVQKFDYLPEAIGDSIFAVAAEEFGFIGASILIVLFLAFSLRGLRVAARAPDPFSKALAAGIVIHISSQSFINIASALGLFPISGIPLIFVSQGGTALLLALAEVGILLNISRYQRH